MTGRDGVRMIEVSSQLTKEEWIHFNERYRKYMSKGARKIVVIGLVVFSVLFLWSGIGLLKGLYFTFHMANFPWFYTFRSLAFQIYGSKMLLTFIFLSFSFITCSGYMFYFRQVISERNWINNSVQMIFKRAAFS